MKTWSVDCKGLRSGLQVHAREGRSAVVLGEPQRDGLGFEWFIPLQDFADCAWVHAAGLFRTASDLPILVPELAAGSPGALVLFSFPEETRLSALPGGDLHVGRKWGPVWEQTGEVLLVAAGRCQDRRREVLCSLKPGAVILIWQKRASEVLAVQYRDGEIWLEPAARVCPGYEGRLGTMVE